MQIHLQRYSMVCIITKSDFATYWKKVKRAGVMKENSENSQMFLNHAVFFNDSETIASLAVKALLYEVSVSPKPGLVDRFNNGSHSDMTFYSFVDSAVVLYPYFKNAFVLGLSEQSFAECFKKLRELGKQAEKTMFDATKGINTHKGAVFSLGIVCCATAWAKRTGNSVFQCCSELTAGIIDSDFNNLSTENCTTAGQKLFLEYGLTGVRGELESGLPSVECYGLPVLEKLLSEGKSIDEAGSNALLSLIANTYDTNMINRGGLDKSMQIKKKVEKLISKGFVTKSEIQKLDNVFIKDHLSPGGCADLLAICFFVHFLKDISYV